MTITVEQYLSDTLKDIEHVFNLPYKLKLKTSGDMKVEVIAPHSQSIVKVIDLDKDKITSLFDNLRLSRIEHILIDNIMDSIENDEYDDFYYSPFQRLQRAVPSVWEEPKEEKEETKAITKSTFEVQDDKVIYEGRSYPILQHISEVKDTFNGELFNRFYNRNQFFKWIKENSNEEDAESATFGDAKYAVVDSEQKHSSECWFIEVYELDKIKDWEWAIAEVEDRVAFFLGDSKGNIYLVNTNID